MRSGPPAFPIGSAGHLYGLFTYTLDFISDLTIQSSHLNQNLGQKVQTGSRKVHQSYTRHKNKSQRQ